MYKRYFFIFQSYEEGLIPDGPNLDESYYMGFNLLNWAIRLLLFVLFF